MSQPFRFRQFVVRQDKAAFKVGTDSVLLGAWAQVAGAVHILDAGTGTGVLALMAAQRNPSATITGIDSDAPSALEAAANFNSSPWSGRMTALHTGLQEYAAQHSGVYDLVISNPPYFSKGLQPGDKRLASARHLREGWGSWMKAIVTALQPKGRCAVIIPASEYNSLVREAALWGLHIYRETLLCSRTGFPVLRYLLEFTTDPMTGKTTDTLHIYSKEEEYSPEYRKLTKDFYEFF